MATIRRRGERWFVQVNRQGLRPARTFSTKVQAERWARATEIAIEDGTWGETARASHTVADLVKLYRHEQGFAFSKSKDAHLTRAGHVWGALKVNCGQQDVMKHFDASAYAAGTKDLALATLTAGVEYARTVWGWDVSPEPWRAARRALTKKGVVSPSKHRDRRCSPAEEAGIVAHWRSNAVPGEIVPFLIDTPLRSGELAALRWTDVERKAAGRFVITVRERKGTRADDRVPLLGRAGAIMEGWWQSRGTALNVLTCTQEEMYRAFRQAADAAGCSDIVLHDLRHEGISRLFERGLQIQQVAIVSGHKKWSTLRRYSHISAESLFDL